MSTIPDIIAVLGNGAEPSRELDLQIHLAVYPDSDIAKMTRDHRRGLDSDDGYSWDIRHGSVVYQKYVDGRCPHNGGIPLPAFTSSIDAALTLMRKHYLWQLKRGFAFTAIVWWIESDWDDRKAPTGYSPTSAALALTTAALVARGIEDRVIR